MIAGEFDLSVGSVYTLTAIVMAVQVGSGLNPFLSAGLAILIGVLIGVLHGTITLKASLPSFIVTLGGLLFWRGAVLLYNGAVQVRFDPGPIVPRSVRGHFSRHQRCLLVVPLLVRRASIACCIATASEITSSPLAATRPAATAIGIDTGRVEAHCLRHRRRHGGVRRDSRHDTRRKRASPDRV